MRSKADCAPAGLQTVKDYVARVGEAFKSPERAKRVMALKAGCARGSFDIAAMRMRSVTTCWPKTAWRSAGERCDAPCNPTARH